MNIADLIFLLLALFFVIKGFFRGFISGWRDERELLPTCLKINSLRAFCG